MMCEKSHQFPTPFRDLLFTTLAYSYIHICILVFWTLFDYVRSLVYPSGLDDFFPAWVNHTVRTSIFPFSLAETILRPYHYPSKKLGLTFPGACNFASIIRIPWCYIQTGNRVHPVFAPLGPLGISLFSASYILSASIFSCLERRSITGNGVPQ